jgi:hypothetical protein
LPLLRPLRFGDVTGDFRGGDDFSSLVLDRRNGEGNIDEAPVLALSNRLVVIDFFASADPFENKGFFVLSIHWNKDRHRPSHGLLRRITKEELRATVPSHNDAVEILGKDRVVRRFDDGRIVLSGAIASQTLWESDRPECSCYNLKSSGIVPGVPDAQSVRPDIITRQLYGTGPPQVHIDASGGRYRAVARSLLHVSISSRAVTGLFRKMLSGTRRPSLFGFPDA